MDLGMSDGRSPHGERGLKCAHGVRDDLGYGRSPHGERGLKCRNDRDLELVVQSLSSWRAWIEITR